MSMERNYMNQNEIYPILDMINRRVKQMQNKGINHHFESPILGERDSGGGSERGGQGFNSAQWQVESFEVTRDTSNPIDSNIIRQVTIIYRNGAIDEITLTRGLKPPVGKEVPDYEYINNLMITEVEIYTRYSGEGQVVTAQIYRENGYGNFRKVELLYNGDEVHLDDEDLWEEDVEDFDNPNDFYNGGGITGGYDDDVLDAEDYAETEYLPSDEPQVAPDGWADGYRPSDHHDVGLDEVVEIVPDE